MALFFLAEAKQDDYKRFQSQTTQPDWTLFEQSGYLLIKTCQTAFIQEYVVIQQSQSIGQKKDNTKKSQSA